MKNVLIIILSLIMCLSFTSCSEREYGELDLYDFGGNYSDNVVLAEQSYLDEYVFCQGYVSGIQSDKFWLYCDKEMDLNKYSHLVCFFDKSDKELTSSIAALSKGDKLIVYGKIIKIEDSYPTDNLHIQIDRVEKAN